MVVRLLVLRLAALMLRRLIAAPTVVRVCLLLLVQQRDACLLAQVAGVEIKAGNELWRAAEILFNPAIVTGERAVVLVGGAG